MKIITFPSDDVKLRSNQKIVWDAVVKKSYKRVLMISGCRSGKSYILGLLLTWYALSRKNALIYYFSNSQRGSYNHFCLQVLSKVIPGGLSTKNSVLRTINSDYITFITGSKFFFTGCTTFNSSNLTRGSSLDCLGVDEFAYYPSNFARSLIEYSGPASLLDNNGCLILCSTPSNSSYFKQKVIDAESNGSWVVSKMGINDIKDHEVRQVFSNETINNIKSECSTDVFDMEYDAKIGDNSDDYYSLRDFYFFISKNNRILDLSSFYNELSSLERECSICFTLYFVYI